jgi:hypothetical protein
MNFLFKKQIQPNVSTSKNKNTINRLITFSTCWYILKSKFPINTYIEWIKNFLSIVNEFNVVIYTDSKSFNTIKPLIDFTNKKIKIIIKPIEEFYLYKYKDFWIHNHELSDIDLHKHIDWRLNMLWNEKIFFVNETMQNRYFDSLYYGWCDIGYFRDRPNDIHSHYLHSWPNSVKLVNDPFKNNIHYGCIQNDPIIYNKLTNDIKTHYSNKLSNNQNMSTCPTTHYNDNCFSGGFFISRKELLRIYANLYDEKLHYYFVNNYFIKDDQSIILDIITMNPSMFHIHRENERYLDNWFMFQRLLM